MRAAKFGLLRCGILLLALSSVSCGTESGNSQSQDQSAADMGQGEDIDQEPACTPGFLGCGCIDGTACFPGSDWVCLEGVCREPACAEGSQGCVCYSNNTCDNDEDGDPMLCRAGLCEQVECRPGAIGCGCLPEERCGEGLECRFEAGRQLCAPVEGCEPGSEGCLCAQERSCGVGLTCVKNTCIASSCRPGALDCFCSPDRSCDGGLQCNDEERCEPIPCTTGSLGCSCGEGEQCTAPDAVCRGGLCEQVDCPAGAEGCACVEGERCLPGVEGQVLSCESGLCRRPDCAPGVVGCGCQQGFRCETGSVCQEGICVVEGCDEGTLHCACQGGLCEVGLRCRQDNVCVDGTGFINNVCGEGGRCERGARCSDEGICRRCTLGVPGCGCDDDDLCLRGAVCLAGTCVAEEDVPPRRLDEDLCFSHCSQGTTRDGLFIPCGPDGLMEACLDGRACVQGSCVLPGEEPVACQSEFDCPHWQTCIEGLCMSECRDNGDCAMAGKQCYEHVCRVPCESNGEACPQGQFCQTEDGESGFCLPALPSEGEEAMQSRGGFSVSTSSLQFNNTRVTQRLAIFNDSPVYQIFRLTKRSHLVQRADGSSDRAVRAADGPILCEEGEPACVCDEADARDCTCQGLGCACEVDQDCQGNDFVCELGQCRPSTCGPGECPLFWLQMGAGMDDPQAGEAMEMGVESGESAEITLANAGGVEGVRYQGALEISAEGLGSQVVDLLYSEVPEGQWAGQMVYMANFSRDGLAPWAVDQASRNTVEHEPPLANALLRLWVAFRNGRISFDEMEAILTSVQSGSWKYANVQQGCPSRNGACYPYDIGALGLETLTSDLEEFPVPSGVVELPFAMNLRMPDPDNDPGLMTGRIASDKALHYAGQPAIELRFVSTPQSCDLESFGACVSWLESLDAEIVVGGRYLTGPEDMGCTAERDGSYHAIREPWLVPGFTMDTEFDDETGRRYRYECRDSRLPFSSQDSEARDRNAPRNTSLALSNPIPDGRARRRRLRLIDGALVNQSQMILFFEERFSSFLGQGEEGFTSYGVMRLMRRATDLDQADEDGDEIADVYQGATPQDDRPEPDDVLAPTCSPEILRQALGNNAQITGQNLPALITTLVDGVPSGIQAQELDGDTEEQVHYFCEDTGLFDGGSQNSTPRGRLLRLPNDDSCTLADNGTCEDGGAGSEFAICALGTDVEDCGLRWDAALDLRVACPAGSRVEFFTVMRSRLSQEDIAAQPCQREGSCQDTLNLWKQNGLVVQAEPRYRCADPDVVFCDQERQDLREGKTFYAAGEQRAVFVQLPALVEEAFRYKTRFRNRQGQNIGFAPEICEPGSDARPYCYDPTQIEQIQQRLDCLLHIHQDWYDALEGTPEHNRARRMLDDTLEVSFSQREEVRRDLPLPVVHDGFERQLAQLLIMQGDDSFTRAFASRFDLSASSTASFEGALFESDGVNLTGAAGYEMYSLYQAAQYYQMVLDRFYTMSPVLWEATQFGVSGRNFVTADTVLRYIDRVIRASTQKARTWGEIAKRYQALGRPDLARSVAERAYTSTYMESVVTSRMMSEILEEATLLENRGQIESAIEEAQVRYKVALVDMQNVSSEISDEITVFGFEPEYIPFPALDAQDFRQSNAFEVFLARARARVQFAREREETALSSNRSFETDQAQFQSELNQLSTNYENQLADLCGTFVVGDEDSDPGNDRVYPAIKKYAHLNDRATLFADPCGLVGNGQIHQASAAFEETALDARALQIQIENVLEEVEIERQRVSEQCNQILNTADFLYGKCERSRFDDVVDDINPFDDPDRSGCIQAQVNALRGDINNGQFVINRLQQVQSILSTSLQLTKCGVYFGGSNCPAAVATTTAFINGTAITETGISAAELLINRKERQIDELERFKMKWQTEGECDMAKVESTARVRTMLLRLRELELEGLRVEHRTRLALSELERLRNQARRLEAQQIEAEQLTINVQAAHNNPNVRIYKNDAIINAELSFHDALRELYKLTRVFEYYTSQSYPYTQDLFLTRTVSRGDKNLENYLNQIEATFYEFEEFFGQPSNRVHIVSLKDDVLNIPFVDEQGAPISDAQRTRELRSRLTDPARLDSRGYIVLPFSTNFQQLSPLTRNHKILYVEADIYGSDNGDLLGRLYLRQRGTGAIRGVEGDKQFHRFDERTGVINTIFGGVRFFENSIYQNHRMRDRPFVNTQWELVINQRDEEVNQDINLNGVTDIRLYIYYTDFTVF